MKEILSRINQVTNRVGKQLLNIMVEKSTNLALSADVTESEALLELVSKTAEDICVLKLHIDIIRDFKPSLIQALQQLAKQHQFILFEDRKFADIGATVKKQYAEGIYRIASWAQTVTGYLFPGVSMIDALSEIGLPLGNSLLVIANLSNNGNLCDDAYTLKVWQAALQHREFVMGFIASKKLPSKDPGFLIFTPGVHLEVSDDGADQRYLTPEYVCREFGTDVIIVGRGIYAASDPKVAAQQYRTRMWKAWCEIN